jgi:hypothetical protein
MRVQNLKSKSCKWACIFTSLFVMPLFAAIKPMTCKTNFGEKSFTIEDNTVAFHASHDDGRSISSVSSATTRRSHKGFKKTLYRDGSKHLISIKDMNNLNANEDFLAITSPKGHKMTFPINCSLLD